MGAEDGFPAALFVEVGHVPLVLFGGVGSAVFAGLLADGVVVFQVVFARVGCAAVLLLGWCLGWFWGDGDVEFGFELGL